MFRLETFQSPELFNIMLLKSYNVVLYTCFGVHETRVPY